MVIAGPCRKTTFLSNPALTLSLCLTISSANTSPSRSTATMPAVENTLMTVAATEQVTMTTQKTKVRKITQPHPRSTKQPLTLSRALPPPRPSARTLGQNRQIRSRRLSTRDLPPRPLATEPKATAAARDDSSLLPPPCRVIALLLSDTDQLHCKLAGP